MSYSNDFKEEIIRKVLSSDRIDSIKSIAKESNIPVRTIRRWVNSSRAHFTLSAYLSDERKLNAVLRTLNISAESKSIFCRSNGLLLEELNEWTQDLEEVLSGGAVSKYSYDQLKSEIERLKKALTEKDNVIAEKDKALCETAALLDLQKKLQIFLEKEGVNLS
jgi:transposase-like protein